MNKDQNTIEAVSVSREASKRYFLQIGLGIFIVPLSNTVIQHILAYLFGHFAPNVYGAWWFSWALSLVPLYCVSLPLFLYVLPKPPKAEGGNGKRPYGVGRIISTCFMAMSAMIIFNYAGAFLTYGINQLSGGRLGRTDALNSIVNASPLWATVLFVVILAPIMEEILFRKILIDRVLPFGEFRACLLSGLFFGFFHGNLRQFFYATALGFLFSYVYVKTRNIFYSIGMHMGINLLGSVIVPYLLSNKNMEGLQRAAEDPLNMTNADALSVILVAGTLLVGAAVMITGIVLFFVSLKKIKFSPAEYKAEGGGETKMLLFNVGSVASFALMTAEIVISLF